MTTLAEKYFKAKIKKLLDVKPTTYYKPMYYYQGNYYRFGHGNAACHIGTYARDEVHWSDKCCLSWFRYNVTIDFKAKIKKLGTYIKRKRII